MKTMWMAMVLGLVGCSSAIPVATVIEPEPLTIQRTAEGRFTHGDVQGDLFIFGHDADPAALSVLLTDGEGTHEIAADSAAIAFHDTALNIACVIFRGTVTRLNGTITVDATCVKDPQIHIVASYPISTT